MIAQLSADAESRNTVQYAGPAVPTLAASILDCASLHQQRASGNRIGLPRMLSQNVQNNAKGKQILAQRTAARKAAQAKTDVRIDALLFCIPYAKTKKGNGKVRMEQVRCISLFCLHTEHFSQDLEVRVSQTFSSNTLIKTAIQALLEAVLDLFNNKPASQAAVTDLKMCFNNCSIVR